jgi:hypothetical protein
MWDEEGERKRIEKRDKKIDKRSLRSLSEMIVLILFLTESILTT